MPFFGAVWWACGNLAPRDRGIQVVGGTCCLSTVFDRNNTVMCVFDKNGHPDKPHVGMCANPHDHHPNTRRVCTATTWTRVPHGHRLVAALSARQPVGAHPWSGESLDSSFHPSFCHHRCFALSSLSCLVASCLCKHARKGLPPVHGYEFPPACDFVSRLLTRLSFCSVDFVFVNDV